MVQRQQIPLKARTERAAQLVLRARIFFDIWLYFEGAETRPALLDTMNQFSEFFRFAPHAHFVSFVVTMASLYDKRSDTITLTALAREIETSGLLTVPVQAEVKALIDQALPIANKVGILRHNAFAHRSANMSYDAAFKAASITAAQMRELTDTSLQLANTLLRVQGCPEQYFNELAKGDAAAMMAALQRK